MFELQDVPKPLNHVSHKSNDCALQVNASFWDWPSPFQWYVTSYGLLFQICKCLPLQTVCCGYFSLKTKCTNIHNIILNFTLKDKYKQKTYKPLCHKFLVVVSVSVVLLISLFKMNRAFNSDQEIITCIRKV